MTFSGIHAPLKAALINSSLNYQSAPNESRLEKVSFLFGLIFNDLQSSKMAAPGSGRLLGRLPASPSAYAAETLNKSEFP